MCVCVWLCVYVRFIISYDSNLRKDAFSNYVEEFFSEKDSVYIKKKVFFLKNAMQAFSSKAPIIYNSINDFRGMFSLFVFSFARMRYVF